MASALARYTLVFYAPPAAVAACKTAIFRAGAGRYPGAGNYTECCWSTSGTGQFRPGDAANPHIGRPGTLEETPEVRVETLCVGVDVVRNAVAALKTSESPPSSPHQPICASTDLLISTNTQAAHIPTKSRPTRFTRWKTFRKQVVVENFCDSTATPATFPF
ncbi:hypothetical protein CDD80_4392 [Ophiocordyceps camponoti-rufipedis]|uniref:ATP phosphoribosyltransferase n=1 Tax=Ophiocordyceps camponoti-rufipedis TaxID=2004952 RepID=A0A2C5YZ60_9HYPO|nr:hypothetical protein CDD80_4392 [Ophiocordyceps camponoti-rufipedis]